MGPKGRKKLVEDYAQYLPQYGPVEPSAEPSSPHSDAGDFPEEHEDDMELVQGKKRSHEKMT